jgi:bis(5'-nucleosyl)-tetraphosphatase (symmetrical)
MPRYAIGDLQGCHDEFRELLAKLRFSADRDELWLTGDLVNRGPKSLAALRLVRSLGANVATVLGNHDLHLLAAAFGGRVRKGDTLDDILAAPDRVALMGWLLEQPLVLHDAARGDLLLHAGLIPQWSVREAVIEAQAVSAALRADPEGFVAAMYGNQPDRWADAGDDPAARRRFAVNVFTRLRFCTADGRVDLKAKGAPDSARPPLKPWFAHPNRRSADTRIVFGHWSTLGLHRAPGLLGLDTGCVWGGGLTAVNLDDPDQPAVTLPCRAWQEPGE